MTDREKVIKGLEHCFVKRACIGCPYHKPNKICNIEVGKDAFDLLKEQEAKQAIKQTCHIMIDGGYENAVVITRYSWICPTCKSLLFRDVDVIDDNYHFCKVCGQAVKWDEPPKEDKNGTD